MRVIHELAPDIVNKIAAGEVIERPAYVVKELIDNAIDAGTSYIYIELVDGGYERIMVADNGSGMSYEDLRIAYKAHTTSKITELVDLHHIKSQGFRGEALASMAAVSEMEIKSRTTDEKTGHLIELKDSVIVSDHAIGMNIGTTVAVKNLFYNTPARKRFLKSSTTELRHCVELIHAYAMAYEQIRFVCSHNRRTLIDLPSTNKLQRLTALLGKKTIEEFVPIEFSDAYISVNGFIAKPQFAHHHKKNQYIFVNNRYIKNSIILESVKKAYGTLIPLSLTTSFILFITIPYEHVDVNIHPKKDEVTFADAHIVIDAIMHSIRSSLESNNLTFQDLRWQKNTDHNDSLKLQSRMRKSDTRSDLGNVLRDSILHKQDKVARKFFQIHNMYIIAESARGLVMIDQHAAHERVLYEKLMKTYTSIDITEKRIHPEPPLILDLSSTEKLALDEYKDVLKKEGFDCVLTSGQVMLHSYPALLGHLNIEDYIRERLMDMSTYTTTHIHYEIEKMITFIACRSAYKAGDELSDEQCHELMNELQTTEHNTTCPHGRPTTIEFSLKEYNRLFKRS